MKKKVAIITLPLRNYNYGGILQNYALQQYLMQNFDVEVETIDMQFGNKESLKRKVKMFLHKTLYQGYYQFRKKSNQYLESFITSRINLSKPLHSQSEIVKYLNDRKIDVLITGSDQVWRLDYAGEGKYKQMYLHFDQKVNAKKISYAASFGFDEWKFPQKTLEIQTFLQNLDAVSVREDSGIDILQKTFNAKGVHHLDPTLLLDNVHYRQLLLQTENPKTERKILYAYILDVDDKKIQILEKICKNLSAELKMIELVSSKLRDINNHNYRKFLNLNAETVPQWLEGFHRADYVVTDSFHGTVFSILFGKSFIALGNKRRGMSRFESLLKMFEMPQRLQNVFNEQNMTKILEIAVDEKRTTQLLLSERQRSYAYFSQFLTPKIR